MFWKKGVAVEETPSEMTLESLIENSAKAPQTEMDEYEALCRETGVESLPLAMQRLRAFLSARQMPTYSSDRVHRFLVEKAKKEKQGGWISIAWCPLRAEDAKHQFQVTINYGENVTWHKSSESVYSKPVPIEALKIVRDVEREMPDTFAFYVSDYKAATPDPFLLVTHKRLYGDHIVAYHWDEPDFTA